MENEKKLREIKVPRGISLGNKRASDLWAKHKKKVIVGTAIAAIGALSIAVVMEFLPEEKPRVQVADFVPPPVVEQTPSVQPAQDSVPQLQGGEASQLTPPSPPLGSAPVLPGTAQLQGSGISQPMATVPPSQLAPQQPGKTAEPSIMELITTLTDRVNEQEKKIASLQEELTRIRSQPQAKPPAREPRKENVSSGNGFDIRRLNLMSITAEAAVVRTGAGTLMTVSPGRAFPGGVVFISYDPSSHVMKTTAGDFLVQS